MNSSTVLIVDDEISILEVAGRYLNQGICYARSYEPRASTDATIQTGALFLSERVAAVRWNLTFQVST